MDICCGREGGVQPDSIPIRFNLALLFLCLASSAAAAARDPTGDVPTGEQRWEIQTSGGISGNLGRFSVSQFPGLE